MNISPFWLFLIATIALFSGYLVQRGIETPSTQASKLSQLGELPNFSFPDSNDQLQSINQWRGKLLVINFWATWCPPCLEEIPDFIRLQGELQNSNVQFVGIAIDGKQVVSEYLSQVKSNYPNLIAGDNGLNLSQQLGNVLGAIPFTLIVDTQGQIVFRQAGSLSARELRDLLEALISYK